MAFANAAHEPVSAIHRAADKAELMDCENWSRDAVGAFVVAAAAQVLERSGSGSAVDGSGCCGVMDRLSTSDGLGSAGGQAPPGRISPCSYAKTAAWTRSRSPSLASTPATCDLTVDDSTYSCVAISALVSPRPSRRSTSCSRPVSVER